MGFTLQAVLAGACTTERLDLIASKAPLFPTHHSGFMIAACRVRKSVRLSPYAVWESADVSRSRSSRPNGGLPTDEEQEGQLQDVCVKSHGCDRKQ